ncbi:hypothetical protein B0J13DRAFT_612810 [Dactylonectria estremocensis]|uniref:Uncharacterized protein n=1 Tax=Dactylonectria estremocensis TaxID=1079267 RepID=A0A9P9IGS0_9HYPO|nr:hypothetical protein B0J13DRAFT_612810 [Dactylonectria estremocensis]
MAFCRRLPSASAGACGPARTSSGLSYVSAGCALWLLTDLEVPRSLVCLTRFSYTLFLQGEPPETEVHEPQDSPSKQAQPSLHPLGPDREPTATNSQESRPGSGTDATIERDVLFSPRNGLPAMYRDIFEAVVVVSGGRWAAVAAAPNLQYVPRKGGCHRKTPAVLRTPLYYRGFPTMQTWGLAMLMTIIMPRFHGATPTNMWTTPDRGPDVVPPSPMF